MKKCIVMIILWTAAASAPLSAGDATLREKYVSQLHGIVQNSDAVIGVAVKDLQTGDEICLNEHEIFPQASAIKIHILSEVLKQANEKRFSLSDIRLFPPKWKTDGSGVLHLLDHETVSMSIRDYAVLMIVLSDNSATNYLIDLIGMNTVNSSLQAYGATETKLQRIMMDYQAAKEGRENISTPKDAMHILEMLYRGTIVNKNVSEEVLSILKLPKPDPGWIKKGLPENVEIADKPGDVEGVKCDVGIVYLPDHPYIICVMTKFLHNDNDGERIITQISRITYSYFERILNSNQYGRRIPK